MNHYSPLDYIKIDIANQMGHDKKTFKQRIAWVDSVKDLKAKTDQADKPAQYYAAVLALEDALAGVPSGHLVGLDACASGITIMGILIGCHVTAHNTGVIGQKRMDMYSECTKEVNTLLGTTMEVDRQSVKEAQMVHFYGSKAEPKRVFGEDTDELWAFYEAQYTVAPGACMVMQEFLDSWQPYALEHSHSLPDGFIAKVPVLQKFKAKIEIDELDHASIAYIYEDNIGQEKGLAVAANITHGVDGFLVREVTRRCNYDAALANEVGELLQKYADYPQQTPGCHTLEQQARDHGFLSFRAMEFITEKNILDFSMSFREELRTLMGDLLEAHDPFPVICIHDEFKCHANHMNDLRKVYQQILAELADSNVGQRIIQEVRDDYTYVLDKLSTDLGNEIMQAEYFLS